MTKHEREAADLVVEVLSSGRISEDITEDAATYSLTENAKGINWDKIDEDRVLESKVVQQALRSLAMQALSGLRP